MPCVFSLVHECKVWIYCLEIYDLGHFIHIPVNQRMILYWNCWCTANPNTLTTGSWHSLWVKKDFNNDCTSFDWKISVKSRDHYNTTVVSRPGNAMAKRWQRIGNCDVMASISGPCPNIKTVFARYGIPMLKIRRSGDSLIFNMGIPVLVRWHFYIETPLDIPREQHILLLWNICLAQRNAYSFPWTLTLGRFYISSIPHGSKFSRSKLYIVIKCSCPERCNINQLNIVTSSNGNNFPRFWPFVRVIHRSPEDSSNKGQWPRALMVSLICVYTNGWANNWDACDLRRHRAQDVTVVILLKANLNTLPTLWIGPLTIADMFLPIRRYSKRPKCNQIWDHFYRNEYTLIPAWISNVLPRKMWDGITKSFPNVNGVSNR